MKKKYAFILMGDYNILDDRAVFESENMMSYIYTVNNIDEAYKLAYKLKDDRVGAVETCGAFSEDNIEKISTILGENIGVARVVATDKEKIKLDKFFSN